MAGRVQQDAFIDDSDESCPLCVEEFDLSDKNFRPCPCGYQVCQFCYNNIKNHMNGLCPACRRPYDDQSIEWKIVSPEEQKADIALQARKKAMARKKESEQKQVETMNRKNLAGIRVVQKNLVYVVGLSQRSSEEEFLKTLRGTQYFGQYGKISKIVVSKAKEGNNSIGVYVTFETKEDAAKCIAAVDGSQNLDRPLRAQYGTTKYCSAFLRNETCGNRNCTFLHETGEDNDSFSRQDLSSMNALSTQRPAQQPSSSRSTQPQPQPQAPAQQPSQSTSAAPQTGSNKPGTHDEAMSRSDSGDGSALPSSASWATKNTHTESRRSSKPASIADPSPIAAPATISSQPAETRQPVAEPENSNQSPAPNSSSSTLPIRQPSPEPQDAFDSIVKTLTTSSFKFAFDHSLYDSDELRKFASHPPLFDDNGGYRRFTLAKAQEQERQKQEEERNVLGAIASAAEDEEEEAPASGSLQLGGEPETQDGPQDSTGRMSAQQRSAIQPPFGSSTAFPFTGPGFQASNATNLTRTLTPQQQHHSSLLRSQSTRQSPINGGQYQQGYGGNTSLHHHQQSNPFQIQNQNQAFNTAQGHARHASRFTFANDTSTASTAVKPVANPQLMAQQAAMMPSNQGKHFQNQQVQQPGMPSTHFYSGVQGPPPGLKSSGTPPISGGGMFGQGYGFAQAMGGSAGFGGNAGTKNSNEEMMRELLRARNGSANDVGKREFSFPFSQQPMTSDAPASSLLSSLYGSQLASHHGYQDHNLQKQKKKGKKHRHANTSSSGGGGIVDLADPSILQARMHHGAAGQGQYGTQGQGGFNPSKSLSPSPQRNASPPLPSSEEPTASSSSSSNKALPKAAPTPAPVLLGLSLPQDFPPLAAPSAPHAPPRMQKKATSGTAIKPVVPVVPTPSERPIDPSKDTLPEELDTGPEQSSTAIGPSKAERSDHAELSKEGLPKHKADTVTDVPPKPSEVREKKIPTPTKPDDKKQRPSKLDIAATKEETKSKVRDVVQSSESARATTKSKSEGSSALETSVPPTPATAVSQMSATSNARHTQPRTIRVPPVPKAEASSSPGLASSSKQASRRASLSSLHQPATPTSERNSDNVSFTTTSMSRANSPPPTKVGTAPMRQVTKSQQKKERQARAKQIEGSSKVEEPPMKVEEVQAPIIGRKKKTKKQRTSGTADSTPTATRPTSPVPNEEEVADEKPPSGPATPAKKGSSKAGADMKEPEAPSSPATPAAAEQQPKDKLTAASIIASLLTKKEITPSAADLFRLPAPGLNHRFEPISPDFPSPEPPSDAQLLALDQGEAINIEKGPNHHVVVLPDRQQVPGLTADQAARYLALRKQALANGDVPSHQALEGLTPTPPRINVEALTSVKQREARTRRLVNRFETPMRRAEETNVRPGAAGGGGGDGVVGKKLGVSVVEAEQNLLINRKEAEGLEKKLAALLKKNRRLAFGNAH